MHLRYQDKTPVIDHVNDFQVIIIELSSMGIKFEDKVRALLLLGSLPYTWETLKVTLCSYAPIGVVTWDIAKARVMNEETRRIAEGASSQTEVLVTELRGRSQRKGQMSSYKGRSKSRGKYANVECYSLP